MDKQVLVPIEGTLAWMTGRMSLKECLCDFLWEALEKRYGSDTADELMDQAMPTVQIDGDHFVVGLEE